MIRRTTLMSALTITLLLGACSKYQPAGDAGDASAQVVNDFPDTPPERLNYWPVVGSLVAGNYVGNCLRMPDVRKLDATIAIGADGKVASDGIGIDIDFRAARKVTLMRVRDDRNQYGSSVLLEMDSEKNGVMNVHSLGGTAGGVSLASDGVGATCGGAPGGYKLNTRPLHQLLADLATTSKQTLSCLDTKNMLVRRDLDVIFDGSVIKVGDAAFDAAAAATEILTIDDAGESMALVVGMPDKRTVTLMYDGAGKLRSLMGMTEHEATHSCDRSS